MNNSAFTTENIQYVKQQLSAEEFEVINWLQNMLSLITEYTYEQIDRMTLSEFEILLGRYDLLKDE